MIEIILILNIFNNKFEDIVNNIKDVDKNVLFMNEFVKNSNFNMKLLMNVVNGIGILFKNLLNKIFSFSNNIKEVNNIVNIINLIVD